MWTEELLEALAAEERPWVESMDVGSANAMLAWLFQRLGVAEQLEGNVFWSSTSPSASLHQDTTLGAEELNASHARCERLYCCPHLQSLRRDDRTKQWFAVGPRSDLAPQGCCPTSHSSAEGARNPRSFFCEAGCAACDAEEALGFSAATGAPVSSAVHCHCLACLASSAPSEGVCCLRHAATHADQWEQRAQRIMSRLDDDGGEGSLDSDNCEGCSDQDDDVVVASLLRSVGAGPLSTDDAERLDRWAQEARSHQCFVVATGSSTEPICVTCCASCRLFAPLYHTAALPCSRSEAVDDDANRLTDEPMSVIFMRACLAAECVRCLALQQQQDQQPSRQQETQSDHSSSPRSSASRLEAVEEEERVSLDELDVAELGNDDTGIFLFKPVMFSDDAITERLERDSQWTFCHVFLPFAHCGPDEDSVVVSVDGETKLEEALNDARELHNARSVDQPTLRCTCVVGFLLQFSSVSAAEETLADLTSGREDLLLVRKRRVYVASCKQWRQAHVMEFCDPNAGTDGTQRRRSELIAHGVEIASATRRLPLLSLLDQASQSSIAADEEVPTNRPFNLITTLFCTSRDYHHHNDSSQAAVDSNETLQQLPRFHCPFSAVSRSLGVFQLAAHVAMVVRQLHEWQSTKTATSTS